MSSAMTAALRLQTVNMGRMQTIRRCMTSGACAFPARNNTITKSSSFIPATNTNWIRAQHTAAVNVNTMRPQTESSTTATMTSSSTQKSNESFSTTAKTEQMEIDHFRSIPWVAKHLSQPHLIISQADSRRPKPGHGDTLLSHTLNSQDAISAYITIIQQPQPQSGERLVTEMLSFLTLGSQLNGWPGVCHGGIVMMILDDAQGQLFTQNKKQKLMKDVPLMTAYLNQTFLKPVRTPCTIMVRAKITKVEGRKHWIQAVMLSEEGEELARCESMFVMLKSNL